MSILPIITMSDLQRRPKAVIAGIKDYAVIQSHGHDRAFVLHPRLGKILVESGMLEKLRTESARGDDAETAERLKTMIGGVLRELSKR